MGSWVIHPNDYGAELCMGQYQRMLGDMMWIKFAPEKRFSGVRKRDIEGSDQKVYDMT